MFVLDYLLYQEDRHSSNWGILKNESSAYLIVFDNEDTLKMCNGSRYFDNLRAKLTNKNHERIKIDHGYYYYSFSLFPNMRKTNHLDQILHFYNNDNTQYREVIDSVINNLDFDKVLSEVEKDREINANLKYVISKMVRDRKNGLIEAIHMDKSQRKDQVLETYSR